MAEIIQRYISTANYNAFEDWTGEQTHFHVDWYFTLSNVEFFAEYSKRGHLFRGWGYGPEGKSTVLMSAISSLGMHFNTRPIANFILALIATGKSNPEAQIEGGTALMRYCHIKDPGENGSAVVKALIETGKSNMGAIDKLGWTALMHACTNSVPDTAWMLINSGEELSLESRLKIPGHPKHSAFTFALKYKHFDLAWTIATMHAYQRRRFAVIGMWL